jgi:prevent-host-death family protein
MKRTVTTSEAASDLPSLLDEVRKTGGAVVIADETGDDVVLVSASEYRQIERMKDRAWSLVREIRARNMDRDPDDICRDVSGVVEEVRQERRGRLRQ